MILGFFAVEAKRHVGASTAELHADRCRQRNPLVRWTEQEIEFYSPSLNCIGIEACQPIHLVARSISSRVDEEWSLSAALGREVSERQNVGSHHKVNEFAFVGFHGGASPFVKE